MKKLLLGSVALIVMSAPVLAADMPVKARPLPPAFSWTGCYIGLNVGYGWGSFDKSDVRQFNALTGALVATHPNFDFDEDGALGGTQIGCNWQSGGWIWGIEADVQVTSIEARTVLPGLFGNVAAPFNTFNTEAQSDLRWFGTVRGRLGWNLTPTSMFYVTGGFAYGQVNSSLTFPTLAGSVVGRPNAHDSQTHYGWTVGVGAEAKIAENFSAKLEYLYVDLGSQDYSFTNVPGTGGAVFNYAWDQKVQIQTIRLGLNYQFNWYGPVVAR